MQTLINNILVKLSTSDKLWGPELTYAFNEAVIFEEAKLKHPSTKTWRDLLLKTRKSPSMSIVNDFYYVIEGDDSTLVPESFREMVSEASILVKSFREAQKMQTLHSLRSVIIKFNEDENCLKVCGLVKKALLLNTEKILRMLESGESKFDIEKHAQILADICFHNIKPSSSTFKNL